MTTNEVSIVVSAKKSTVKSDMSKAEGEAKEGAGKINSALKGIGEIAAGAAVFAFGKSMFDAAEEAEKAGKLTEQVIKTTGGAAHVSAAQVDELSTAISKNTGASADAIHVGANLLLTFTNIKNGVGKGNDIFNQATQTVTDMTAALNHGQVTAEGLSSSSIQLGKALNDPIKGITALQRVGVTFDDQQKKAIATDMKRGDVMGAQKIILKELNREFGGAAAAQATPADKAAAAWKAFQVELGEKLLPTVDTLLNDFIRFLPVLMSIIDGIVKFGEANKPIVVFLAAVIAGIKAWTIVQAVLDSELIANPIGLIVVAIAALVAGIIWVATKTRFFQDTWRDVWGFMKSIGAWFAGPFVDFFTKDIPAAFHVLMGQADKYLVAPFLGYLGFILHAAVDAFGWIPGIGPKLKSAEASFKSFAAGVNSSLSGIHDKTVNINIQGHNYTGVSAATLAHGLATGGIAGAALGGVQSGLRWVGEQGAELVKLPVGSMVYPHGQSMGMAGAASGGHGGTAVTVGMDPTASGMSAMILRMLRVEVRNQGGQLAVLGLKPVAQQVA